jgi:hypothetical protein
MTKIYNNKIKQLKKPKNVDKMKFKIVLCKDKDNNKFLLITRTDFKINVNNFFNDTKQSIYKYPLKDIIKKNENNFNFNVIDGSNNYLTLENKYYKHLNNDSNLLFYDDFLFIH